MEEFSLQAVEQSCQVHTNESRYCMAVCHSVQYSSSGYHSALPHNKNWGGTAPERGQKLDILSIIRIIRQEFQSCPRTLDRSGCCLYPSLLTPCTAWQKSTLYKTGNHCYVVAVSQNDKPHEELMHYTQCPGKAELLFGDTLPHTTVQLLIVPPNDLNYHYINFQDAWQRYMTNCIEHGCKYVTPFMCISMLMPTW